MRRSRNLKAALSGAVLMAVPVSAAAQPGEGYYHGHMWDGGWHGWFVGPLMMVFWLLILAGAALLLLRLFGVSGRGDRPRERSDADALAILRERFARGEIDKAEFEERLALLKR